MNAAVVGDLLARDRRRSQPAVVIPSVDRELSYHDFITTAYKSGNVLRYLGLNSESTLAVDPTVGPEPLLAFFGAAQLGASTTFDPTTEARIRLVSVDDESIYKGKNGRLVVFGGPPTAASTTHWEKAVWSENPAFPPTEVDPDSIALVAGGETYNHTELLGMAETAVDELSLIKGSRLAVRTPLSTPETVGGGLVAALLAGATAVFVEGSKRDVDADAALINTAAESTPEARRLSIAALSE